MPGFASPVLRLLRASLLALLVLGVMVRPVLNQVGELHQIEHMAAEVAEHGHAHPGQDAPDPAPDHMKGAHGLMHQTDAGFSADVWPIWNLPSAVLPESVLPMAKLAAVPLQRLTTPFRPPIV
ncbi:MAG TPA: hypothetical protein DDZ67_13470 [Xanthomonadaceae bacterium]|nr:hypothetical protein [Xanthomonadaceae bacterium]